MYFISYLTDVVTMTYLFYPPKLLTQPNFKIWIGFLKLHRDNFASGGNLSYFYSCLTDNLSNINFLHYPSTFKCAKCLTSNMFSEAPRGQIKESYDFRACDLIWVWMTWLYFYMLMFFDELMICLFTCKNIVRLERLEKRLQHKYFSVKYFLEHLFCI